MCFLAGLFRRGLDVDSRKFDFLVRLPLAEEPLDTLLLLLFEIDRLRLSLADMLSVVSLMAAAEQSSLLSSIGSYF